MQEEQPSSVRGGARRELNCRACGAAIARGARFCSRCGVAADAAGLPAGGRQPHSRTERRLITLVFCDVVDSTALAELLDPEDLTHIIGQFHRAVRSAMSEFDGFVARHMGDGTLTYFGYPEAHEDDAERAVRAALRALEIVSSLSIGGRSLQAHIGIATGLVVVGDIVGMGRDIDIDVAGATPNLAARLQNLAAPNAVVVADSTRRLVGDLIEWRDLGFMSVKGIAKPVRAWQAMGLHAVGSRFDAQHEGALAPLLGREAEMARMRAAWDDAREGRGRVVLVGGEAGIGKSRLAMEMLDGLRGDNHARLRYYSSPHRLHSPLHPFIQQLEHIAGFAREDGPQEKLAKLEHTLPVIPARDLQLIAEMLLISTAGRFPVLQLGPQKRRELQMEALLSVVDIVCARQPLVMLFEDAHWSDESSRDLLGRLAVRCAELRLLLLVTARPEFDPPWSALPHVARLSLGPLSAGDSVALAGWVAAGRPLSAHVAGDIFSRSDGIPLYIEELTQSVIESGLENPSSDGTVPTSLQASLQARLDRLGKARDIAEVAACIGREFPGALLAAVANRAPAEMDQALHQLVEASLILPRSGPGQDGESLVFRHALLRDVAYRSMVREKRRALHALIAQALEGHFPERVAAQPDLMAHHCAEGGLFEKAVGHWFLAGVQAMRRSAMTEALVYLRRGLDTLKDLPAGAPTLKLELQLTIALGQAQIATQGYAVDSTRETFERARRLCEGLNDPPQLLSVLHGLWTNALMTADMVAARDQALTLLERGRTREDPLWLLMGHRFCGVTHHPLGAFPEAVGFLRRGITLYEPAQRATYASVTVDDPEIVMLTYLSWALMCMGELDEARACSARGLEKARGLGQVYSLAHALNGASFVALTIDSPEAGLARIDEMMPLLEEHGIAYYGAVGLLFKGWCLAAMGEAAQARVLLEQGMKAYRATGSRLYLAGFLRMTAESLARGTDKAAALEYIGESFALMKATRQHWDEAEIHRVRGQLLLARGRREEALAELELACAIAGRQGAALWALRASCDLALLRAEGGAREQAHELLAPVCERFAGQSPLPDIARAHLLLRSLA